MANMFFRKDDGRIIDRNFILIGLICRDIGMHRFRLISGFVFNIGFVQIGGMIVSCGGMYLVSEDDFRGWTERLNGELVREE